MQHFNLISRFIHLTTPSLSLTNMAMADNFVVHNIQHRIYSEHIFTSTAVSKWFSAIPHFGWRNDPVGQNVSLFWQSAISATTAPGLLHNSMLCQLSNSITSHISVAESFLQKKLPLMFQLGHDMVTAFFLDQWCYGLYAKLLVGYGFVSNTETEMLPLKHMWTFGTLSGQKWPPIAKSVSGLPRFRPLLVWIPSSMMNGLIQSDECGNNSSSETVNTKYVSTVIEHERIGQCLAGQINLLTPTHTTVYVYL